MCCTAGHSVVGSNGNCCIRREVVISRQSAAMHACQLCVAGAATARSAGRWSQESAGAARGGKRNAGDERRWGRETRAATIEGDGNAAAAAWQSSHPFRQVQPCILVSRPVTTTLHCTRLTALFLGLPRWDCTRKVKPIWISLKRETVSGSGISWVICKSVPRSRQITTRADGVSDAAFCCQYCSNLFCLFNVWPDMANRKGVSGCTSRYAVISRAVPNILFGLNSRPNTVFLFGWVILQKVGVQLKEWLCAVTAIKIVSARSSCWPIICIQPNSNVPLFGTALAISRMCSSLSVKWLCCWWPMSCASTVIELNGTNDYVFISYKLSWCTCKHFCCGTLLQADSCALVKLVIPHCVSAT